MQRSPSSSVFKSKLTDHSTEIDKMIFLTRANSVGKNYNDTVKCQMKGSVLCKINHKQIFILLLSLHNGNVQQLLRISCH